MKRRFVLIYLWQRHVALLVSAWIETGLSSSHGVPTAVALLVSAWIETANILLVAKREQVALLVSAWIETR